MLKRFWFFLVLLLLGGLSASATPSSLRLTAQPLTDVPVVLECGGEGGEWSFTSSSSISVRSSNLQGPLLVEKQKQGQVALDPEGTYFLTVHDSGAWKADFKDSQGSVTLEQTVLPGFYALGPPLLAIALSLITKEVILSLFAGTLLGAVLLKGSLLQGYWSTLDQYIVGAYSDSDHVYILLFTVLLGGMTGLLTSSGSMSKVVESLARYADGRRGSQVITWFMGIAIFFDDYANTLIVGNSMRPLTDRFKVSRQKLAYLVDSTAAPIAGIAVISTWIGYELTLIKESLETIGMGDMNTYTTFLSSVLHRYYSIFTIIFVGCIAWMGRDFGPMLRAEREFLASESEGDGADQEKNRELLEEVSAKVEKPLGSWFAITAVFVVISLSIAGLIYTGMQSLDWVWPDRGGFLQNLGEIFGSSNSFSSLLWASIAANILCLAGLIFSRRMSTSQAFESMVEGMSKMFMAVIILGLAWSIGAVCKDLNTAGFLVNLAQGWVSAALVPLLTFVISALIAFATGTSWGTMAIVMPLSVPLAHHLSSLSTLGPEQEWNILVGTIAGVLSGATFGDHCSPISDTTIMSSMASQCDHIEHVKTQAPYALVTALVACFVGSIPAGFGANPWICNIVGIIACVLIVRFVGRPTVELSEPSS